MFTKQMRPYVVCYQGQNTCFISNRSPITWRCIMTIVVINIACTYVHCFSFSIQCAHCLRLNYNYLSCQFWVYGCEQSSGTKREICCNCLLIPCGITSCLKCSLCMLIVFYRFTFYPAYSGEVEKMEY